MGLQIMTQKEPGGGMFICSGVVLGKRTKLSMYSGILRKQEPFNFPV